MQALGFRSSSLEVVCFEFEGSGCRVLEFLDRLMPCSIANLMPELRDSCEPVGVRIGCARKYKAKPQPKP